MTRLTAAFATAAFVGNSSVQLCTALGMDGAAAEALVAAETESSGTVAVQQQLQKLDIQDLVQNFADQLGQPEVAEMVRKQVAGFANVLQSLQNADEEDVEKLVEGVQGVAQGIFNQVQEQLKEFRDSCPKGVEPELCEAMRAVAVAGNDQEAIMAAATKFSETFTKEVCDENDEACNFVKKGQQALEEFQKIAADPEASQKFVEQFSKVFEATEQDAIEEVDEETDVL